jgi:hypothetical protein
MEAPRKPIFENDCDLGLPYKQFGNKVKRNLVNPDIVLIEIAPK